MFGVGEMVRVGPVIGNEKRQIWIFSHVTPSRVRKSGLVPGEAGRTEAIRRARLGPISHDSIEFASPQGLACELRCDTICGSPRGPVPRAHRLNCSAVMARAIRAAIARRSAAEEKIHAARIPHREPAGFVGELHQRAALLDWNSHVLGGRHRIPLKRWLRCRAVGSSDCRRAAGKSFTSL
jgi:hypothetical protein